MITRDEAFALAREADSILEKLTKQADSGQDIMKAVYGFLQIARQAEEWRGKLGKIHQRDWEEWCKTHEADGRVFINWWHNGEPPEKE